jgi:hypothetical protein
MGEKRDDYARLRAEYADCSRLRDEERLPDAAADANLPRRIDGIRAALRSLCTELGDDPAGLERFFQYEDRKSGYRAGLYSSPYYASYSNGEKEHEQMREFAISLGADLEDLDGFFKEIDEMLAHFIMI